MQRASKLLTPARQRCWWTATKPFGSAMPCHTCYWRDFLHRRRLHHGQGLSRGAMADLGPNPYRWLRMGKPMSATAPGEHRSSPLRLGVTPHHRQSLPYTQPIEIFPTLDETIPMIHSLLVCYPQSGKIAIIAAPLFARTSRHQGSIKRAWLLPLSIANVVFGMMIASSAWRVC